MTAVLTLGDGGHHWRCDSCGLQSVPHVELVGWGWDEYPGGPHHWCPECILRHGIHVGTPAEWEAAWERLG